MRKSCPMLQYGETWGHYAKWNKSVTKKTNVSYKWDHVVCTAAELLSKESCLGLGGRVRLNYSLEFRVYFARCKSSRSLLYNNVYIVYYTIHITMNTMVNFMLVFKIFFWCGSFLKSLLNLLQHCFCFMFWFFDPEACGILALQPETEPVPPILQGKVLTTGLAGKSQLRRVCFF